MNVTDRVDRWLFSVLPLLVHFRSAVTDAARLSSKCCQVTQYMIFFFSTFIAHGHLIAIVIAPFYLLKLIIYDMSSTRPEVLTNFCDMKNQRSPMIGPLERP
jgi:hypothetical protein